MDEVKIIEVKQGVFEENHKDAEELIHNHLNDFESFVITELEEFEEVLRKNKA